MNATPRQLRKVSRVPVTTVGAWLRRARTHRKLSQEAVASAIGVSQRLVSRWENGESRVPREHLVSILRHHRIPRHRWLDVLLLPQGTSA